MNSRADTKQWQFLVNESFYFRDRRICGKYYARKEANIVVKYTKNHARTNSPLSSNSPLNVKFVAQTGRSQLLQLNTNPKDIPEK
jgi:hypothetical protein